MQEIAQRSIKDINSYSKDVQKNNIQHA